MDNFVVSMFIMLLDWIESYWNGLWIFIPCLRSYFIYKNVSVFEADIYKNEFEKWILLSMN